jgi:hypothetical protein
MPVELHVYTSDPGARYPQRHGVVSWCALPIALVVEGRSGADTTVGRVVRSLFAGTLGIGELTDTGDLTFTELHRKRTHRNADKNGRYRWYNDYQLPDRHGGGTLTVRLHGNDTDTTRKLNRTENLRPIPPTDPDFARLYPRRNDAESINRDLDDTLYLRRAHTLGHARQHLNLLGYALVINGVTLHRHHRHRAPDRLAA